MSAINATSGDPLAHATEKPDISALMEECERAHQNALCNMGLITQAESERYQLRDGKDGSGRLFQKNLKGTDTIVRPWDGCPDPDAALTDEICENEVDADLLARAMGVLGTSSSHLTNLSAAQSAELLAVARFVERAIEQDLDDDEELLAQMKANNGFAVLNPGWRESYELVERKLDLESFINQVDQVSRENGDEASPPQESPAQALYTAILDATLEDAAAAAIQKLFAYLPKRRALQIVRDLRKTSEATFLDRQLCEKGPCVRTLIPGYNYFVMGSTGRIAKARGHLVIERMYQAELEAAGRDNEWNDDFIKRVITTQGEYSALGENMKNKDLRSELQTEDKTIEIWTTSVLQFDEETGAAGIYCTTFSPHVLPDREGTTQEHYAHHYLLDYAHRCPPFILARREVNGPGMFDSRSVPDITTSNANVIRNLQKAGLCRAHLEVDPPRALIGSSWSKKPALAPGAWLETIMPGADVKDLGPTRGNPQVAETAIERVERGTHRLFAFADPEVHPSRWQPRALRKSKRALIPWRQCYTQLVVLCYQHFSQDELAQIIGHWPQLALEDVLRHRITLTFDPRALDNDWRKDTLETYSKLLMMDKGGTLDTNKLITLIGNLTDPALIASVTQDPAGASARLYRKVQQDVNDIMLGNPPPMVEMDATAGNQFKMAMDIIHKNENYQKLLRTNEDVLENMRTYMKNLQHSEQETAISPTQGRLGVAQMPERPVSKGTPQLGEGGGGY